MTKKTNPSQLLLGLVLLAGAASAQATNVTYSFVGDPNSSGNFQTHSAYTYDSTTGIYNYSANDTIYSGINGTMSFTVDASRYSDVYSGANGITYMDTASLALPWLTSTSTVNSPLFSQTLTIPGTSYSDLYAYDNAYSGGQGYFHIYDYGDYNNTITYDDLGRIATQHLAYSYNLAYGAGDVTLGLIDGSELPMAISNLSAGHFEQTLYSYWVTYSYDANGTQSYLADYSNKTAHMGIASTSIDLDTQAVPEPASLALVAIGLMGLALRRRRQA